MVLADIKTDVALTAAENLRKKIEKAAFDNIKITASFGLSCIHFGAKTPEDIIHQADQALYHSKSQGRNTVTVWNEQIGKVN